MRGPVIVNQISAELGAAIARHPSQPQVIDSLDKSQPWDIPAEAEILLTRAFSAWADAPADLPARPSLRWVQTLSAGVEGYPAWLMEGRQVTCGRGLNSGPIAEYVLAAMLGLEKRLDTCRVRRAEDWRDGTMGTLIGKQLGLLGYGSIGQEIARRAHAFDMEVLALRRGPWDATDPYAQPAASAEALFASSDYLVLATPLTPQTRGMVDAALLAHAKPGLHLINISRGGVLDEAALIAALDAGRLSGATLDVTMTEPLPEGDPLLGREDIFITPHISYLGGTPGARLQRKFLANLDAYLEGRPLSDLVDPARGY